MLTLIIDTSNRYLALGLLENNKILAQNIEELERKQSELLISRVDDLLKVNGYNVFDLNQIVVTDGPGSYTGMRVALTFVKVLGLIHTELKVYRVNTLLSFIGLKKGFVFMDARSSRVFGAFSNQGLLEKERIYKLEELSAIREEFFGHLDLLNMEEKTPDIIENLASVEKDWILVPDIDQLVPRYLK